MKKNDMSELTQTSYLSGPNMTYLEDLYEDFLEDPSSVDAVWQEYFNNLPKQNGSVDVPHSPIREYFAERAKRPVAAVSAGSDASSGKQYKVTQLINAYRSHGHQHASLDPLGLTERHNVPSLHPEYYGLTEQDMDQQFSMGDFSNVDQLTLRELLVKLKSIYCGSYGLEYMHITNTEETDWLQSQFEDPNRLKATKEEKVRILEDIIHADSMENYLGRKFVGQKRFSLEGGDSLIPMLNEVVHRGGAQGVKEFVIGMAHRGRLNVLVNVMGKPFDDLIGEFEGTKIDETSSGDVKYHMGFSADVDTPGGVAHLALAFNPSHLEAVCPVVEGSVRARQRRRADLSRDEVLPVLLHGDASFSGQGVIMETFNMSQARGYCTGGTVHFVVNNQIGFTTSNPLDSRSTLYCTDIGKMVQAPIFHVNGDDPEAAFIATQIALDYRNKFHKDIVIDLVCYRRHGHQEVDEPMATQPLMYQVIKKHPVPYKIFAERLIADGSVTQADVDACLKDSEDHYDQGKSTVKTLEGMKNPFVIDWSVYYNRDWRAPADTSIPKKDLLALAKKLDKLNTKLTLQPQVKKMMASRAAMTSGDELINWGYAETLAYATLLEAGYPVRVSGQDCERGTFSHRHAVLHDYKTGELLTPLNHLSNKQAPFIVINSTLSEEGVVGFEYGFAGSDPNSLVIWEAQFGDFANGAQVYTDQFISSGEQKWGRLCGLVMLLPHGYEGQGPEHSSARLERYLQLCAEDNMQVCVPSTPAQIYHLLRRQAVRPFRKPLIVMSPKSLLRHRQAVSMMDELASGEFQLVIDDASVQAKDVDRVVLCSGKVYYDLLAIRDENKQENVALVRVEQLYPFPDKEVVALLKKYKSAKDIVWCQEEPKNQGAWYSSQHNFFESLASGQTLRYVGRKPSASTAVGYPSVHKREQQALVNEALKKQKG